MATTSKAYKVIYNLKSDVSEYDYINVKMIYYSIY